MGPLTLCDYCNSEDGPHPLSWGAIRAKLSATERERDEARAEVARLKNAIAPTKSATKKCVACGAALNESGPYSQKYCGRSCLSEDEGD